MSGSYYNENDPNAAAWLRELIKAGAIAPGEVDDRDIRDVRPGDLAGFDQCHFFAGIGVWSYALRLARWPDDRKVWTGSCPCQPFSAAGKGAGFDDERHLWPAWFHLIEECRPDELFGEQVASPAGLDWFDLVRSDMEGASYACGSVDLCAAGVGAPHIRQRLWWVAHADGRNARTKGLQRGRQQRQQPQDGSASRLAVTSIERRERLDALLLARGPYQDRAEAAGNGEARELDFAAGSGCEGLGDQPAHRIVVPAGAVSRAWSGADWIYCTDDKYRPVEPGTFPLAHGAPARVGRLRGYGNAIVSEAAAEVIRASMLIA